MLFQPGARNDALEVARYIRETATAGEAERWYEALVASLQSLETMPRRCPMAQEADAFPEMELRQLNFHSHRIIFAVLNETVQVLHIRHMAQDNVVDP